MISGNRSTCSVRPYIRATCNPDADSWVANFVACWIDPQTGLAIPRERRGAALLHHLAEEIVWTTDPVGPAVAENLPPGIEPLRPISVTFISATVFEKTVLLLHRP